MVLQRSYSIQRGWWKWALVWTKNIVLLNDCGLSLLHLIKIHTLMSQVPVTVFMLFVFCCCEAWFSSRDWGTVWGCLLCNFLLPIWKQEVSLFRRDLRASELRPSQTDTGSLSPMGAHLPETAHRLLWCAILCSFSALPGVSRADWAKLFYIRLPLTASFPGRKQLVPKWPHR